MSDSDLKTFKIGDTHQPTVAASASHRASQAAKGKPTVGFPRLEKLLETETAETVDTKMNAILTNLGNLESQADSPKEKACAKRATAAVSQAHEMLIFLYETKSLVTPGG
ncbi:MAG: hypothetical protein VYA34_11350 [Myxococcota bacterium]|nr:hypothetical protein [Myxococcota bacterium]